jgi:hypothetical protein
MLLVCIRSYLTSFLRYEFLIFDSYHPDTLYLRQQGCEDPWLFIEAKRLPRAKCFANSDVILVPNNLSNLQRR